MYRRHVPDPFLTMVNEYPDIVRTARMRNLYDTDTRYRALWGPQVHVAEPPLPAASPSDVDQRRIICRQCAERPIGCWKNHEFGCDLLRRKAEDYATSHGTCPLEKWQVGLSYADELVSNTRTLIFMLYSDHYRRRFELCRDTWHRDAREAGQGVVVVRSGRDLTQPTELHGSVLQVPVIDTYAALPGKVQAVLQWALTRDDWDYLFKADDDTYISIRRFLAFDPKPHDYIGHSLWWGGVRYAHGGGGYFLSRRAVEIAAAHIATPLGAEDLEVGRSLKDYGGIWLNRDGRFIGNGSPERRPRRDNHVITTHRIPERLWWQTHYETGLHGDGDLAQESPRQRANRIRDERRRILSRKRCRA